MEDGWSDAFGKEGLKKVLLAPSFKGPKKRKGIIEIDIDGFLNFGQSLNCGYNFTYAEPW